MRLVVRLAPRAVWGTVVGTILFAACALCQGGTIRVPADHSTIQEAVDGATPGDVILIGRGTYAISEPLSFRGKPVAVRGEEGPSRTVIRRTAPAARGSVVIFDGAEGPGSVLEGFTVTGGTGTQLETVKGGGILCLDGASPTLKDLVITENRATYGGAIHCLRSSPTLVDCVLSRNVVTCGGGAFCDAASPTFIRCTIRGNRGSYASSGVHSKNGSAPLLESCRIIGNTTYYGGGVDSFESSPKLVNCVIAGNVAQCGGGAYVAPSSSMLLVHCTIAQNRAGEGGGLSSVGLNVWAVNCILFGNEAYSTTLNGHACLVNTDPSFESPGVFDYGRFSFVNLQGEFGEVPDFAVVEPDYRLRPESVAVDAGAFLPEVVVDIDGVERPQGSGPDIGAHERCAAPSAGFLRGDVNGDGDVDLSDAVGLALSVVGREAVLPCRKSGDSNDDGRIDMTDVIHLLGGAFLGGELPRAPFPDCGPDPTPDGLDCEASPVCAASH